MGCARAGRRGCVGVVGTGSEEDGVGSRSGLEGARSKEDPRARATDSVDA